MDREPIDGGKWFANDEKANFFSSGCALLDCVLGGGWAERRVINIVGDSSTGKTLLAIEACVNFENKHKGNCHVVYDEPEAAFDAVYAKAIGLNVDAVQFMESDTIEDWHDSLMRVLKEAKADRPVLYVLDSLDALTSNVEIEQGSEPAGYGMQKAKHLSRLFRLAVRAIKRSNATLMIVSQTRDNIGVTFGRKEKRSGGRALTFYCSQILWLHRRKNIKKKRQNIERSIGVDVHAKCEKNKVGKAFRECVFPIMFDFGIDDVKASLQWLQEVKMMDRLKLKGSSQLAAVERRVAAYTPDKYRRFRSHMSRVVRKVWAEVEALFEPPRRKYGD